MAEHATIADDLVSLAVDIDTVRQLPGNPRRGDVDAVAASLTRFGQRKPIVVSEDGVIVAGNHTWEAAKRLGWPQIAVVRVADDDATAKAFALADNRTAELGGYDEEALLDLIRAVGDFDPDLLGDTGWDDESVQDLIDRIDPGLPDVPPPDDPPEPPADPRSKQGDVWLLGPHRIICGDCRNFSDVETLVNDRVINVAFTSPPYASQRKYDKSSGFVPIAPDEYVDWFDDVQANVRAVLAPDGSWFVNIKEHCDEGQRNLYVKDLTIAHVRRWSWMFVDELCWVHNGLPGSWDSRFKNQFEPIFHFSAHRKIKFHPSANATESKDAFSYTGKLAPASTGNPISWSGSDVERVSGVALPGNVLQIAKSHVAVAHEAMFPVGLPAWFIRAYSDPGDAIFDPFMGSGSTLMAAHAEGRVAYGCEISPGYVDVICRRWQEYTGSKPVLESTGEPHDFTDQP